MYGQLGVGYEEGPFDVEDFALGLVRFEGGRTIFVEVSWALNARPVSYSYVCGTEEVTSLYPSFEAFKTDGTPIVMEPMQDSDPPVRFVEDLLSDRPPLGPGEDGLVVMKILEAIYTSAEKGHEVRIR